MRDKKCEIKMRDKKCEMIEYCEIPGQALWSRNLTKKGKAKTGRTGYQCVFFSGGIKL